MILRDYQRDAVARIGQQWNGGTRSTLLVLATGLGKSVCASHVAAARRPIGRTLFIAHREELLTQISGHFERAGLTTELEKAEHKATVITSNPSDVVVASIQTLKRKRLQRFPPRTFRTIIIDEAHRAAARTYREVLKYFDAAQVLGLTATPDRTDEVGLSVVFDDAAMRYGIREGIGDGWLVPLRAQTHVVAELDMASVRTVAGDLSATDLEEQVKAEATLHRIADPLVKESGDRPTVVYTPGVESAHELTRVLAGYVGADAVASIDGKTPKDTRREILASYARGELRFLVNCLVLTEGWDAPHTSCVAVCRPTKSRSLLAQMIGRGTRPLPGLVDGLSTPAERRAAIAASAKPDCLVLDFTARDRIDLVGPADVLAGEDLPGDAREAVRQATEDRDPRTVEEILEEAEKAGEMAQQRLELDRRRARVKVMARYVKNPIQLVGLGDEYVGAVEDMSKASKGARKGQRLYECRTCYGKGCPKCKGTGASNGVTAKQTEWLARFGVKLPKSAVRRQATAALQVAFDRNLCTVKQARVLSRAGLRTDLTKAQASEALNALADNGWQPTSEMRERWG